MRITPYIVVILAAALIAGGAVWFTERDHIGSTVVESNDGLRARLIETLRAKGAQAAIAELKNETRAVNECHELMHELGREHMGRSASLAQAMQVQEYSCVSGFMHGILERYFADAGDDAALADICLGLPSGSLRRWQCSHGIGHGLMFALANDLPAAIERCDKLDNEDDRSACANGAFMENFNADDDAGHGSRFLNPDDPSYPCMEQEKYAGDCAMTAPIYYLKLHPEDLNGALRWCGTLAGDMRADCVYGVGAQAARRHINTMEVAAAACGVEDDCLAGALGYYFENSLSWEATAALCASLDTTLAIRCRAIMPELMERYRVF